MRQEEEDDDEEQPCFQLCVGFRPSRLGNASRRIRAGAIRRFEVKSKAGAYSIPPANKRRGTTTDSRPR